MTELEYRKFVQHQRSLCDAHINLKLDDLCERAGFTKTAWRRWKFDEAVVRFKINMSKFAAKVNETTISLQQLQKALVKE